MGRCIQSITEMLYECYTEENPIDTEETKEGFREIDQIMNGLSIQDNNRVFAVVCGLCTQHERQAFLEGLRVGVQLFQELTTENRNMS